MTDGEAALVAVGNLLAAIGTDKMLTSEGRSALRSILAVFESMNAQSLPDGPRQHLQRQIDGQRAVLGQLGQ